MYFQAFLTPFKAPRHQKNKADSASTAYNVASVYDYEAEDPEVVKKVNGHLEELHKDDNEEGQVTENYVDAM